MRTLYVAMGRTTTPPLQISIPILADTEKAVWIVANALRPTVQDWRVETAEQISAWERVPAFEYAKAYNDGRPYDAELIIAEATRWFREQAETLLETRRAPSTRPLLDEPHEPALPMAVDVEWTGVGPWHRRDGS